jgi:DNA-binding MarR family transcriptional regulator
VARHLGLPKSTTSVLVKGLAGRGFVKRARDSTDERRLALVLTAKGRQRVASDTVLDPDGLKRSLKALSAADRTALLEGLERLADAAGRLERAG